MTDTDTATEAGTFDERLHAAARHRYSGVTTLARWERDAFCAGARWARTDAAASTVTAEQVEAAARAIYVSDREGTLPAGFAERSWDLDLAAERDRYLRHARVALEAAGLTVPEEVQA